MAAFDSRQDDEMISTINIIPFVDIVLVLLIIFMVTSTAIVKAAIKVELPQAASAGAQTETTVNIVLTREEVIFLDGEQVTPDRAAALIRDVAKDNPAAQAVISADKKLEYGTVVKLIDLVKVNGIRVFALNIEREIVASRE